jgi:hypothetical protein
MAGVSRAGNHEVQILYGWYSEYNFFTTSGEKSLVLAGVRFGHV